jgi:hypothetical protein
MADCLPQPRCLPAQHTAHVLHLYRACGFIISGARKAGVPLQRSNSPSSPSTKTLLHQREKQRETQQEREAWEQFKN